MNPRDPNVGLIESIARALGSLNERVVFVGGCAVSLLLTDDTRPPVRATQDVDLVAEITTRGAYYELAEQLRRAGFAEDPSATAMCRWRHGTLKIDVMPTDKAVLGFGSRWFSQVVRDAHIVALPSSTTIRLIPPPLLLATKIEAFYDRGKGDFGASHDMEDIVNLIDGRPELVQEIRDANPELREYLQHEVDDLLDSSFFIDSLAWHLAPDEQARVEVVIERLRRIAKQ